jgi:hypothetical protein
MLAAFLVGCSLMLAMAPRVSADANANPKVLPVNSNPYGASYSEWSARWWQWTFSVPASKNPAAAGDGPVDCTAGQDQSGSVWFLAGVFGKFNAPPPGAITRSCSIPTGKALFFPLVNGWADNTCMPPDSIDMLRGIVASSLIPPSELEASVDGKQFTNLTAYRAISPVFAYTLPAPPDNLLFFAFNVTVPSPECWPNLPVFPAVADGFYLMLAPLSAGQHQLKFGGTTPGASQDFTYNLTVGP